MAVSSRAHHWLQGRFALVIEAALHYAKLELGIAPSRDELKEEERRQKEEQKEGLRQDGLLGEDGIRGGLQNAKQNVCPPKRRAKPKPRARRAAAAAARRCRAASHSRVTRTPPLRAWCGCPPILGQGGY